MYGKQNRKLFNNVNLTPLLDAIFILFIFFIIISNFKKKEVVKVNIPNSINNKTDFSFSKNSSKQIDIKIDKDSKIYINERFISKNSFEKTLKTIYKNGNLIYLKSDRKADVQTFIYIVETLKKSNIKDIQIYMNPKDKK